MRTLLFISVFQIFSLSALAQAFTLLDPAFVAAANQPAAPAGGGPAFVQGTGNVTADDNTAVKSFASTPTAGNTIVVCVAVYNESATDGEVTDNQTNTYYRRVTSTLGTRSHTVAIFTATNINSSGTFTVTASPGTTTYPSLAIAEFSGVPLTSASAAADGSSTAPAAGAITVADVIIGVTSQEDGTTTITQGAWATGGVIYEYENNDKMPINCSYALTSGSVNATWTLGASRNWSAASASLAQ